jgi:hypothetical protein
MNTALYQNIAYTALTIASVIVAITSLIVSSRNYFGTKPQILPGGVAIIQISAETSHIVTTSFEVWNSRQYPIVIKSAAFTFPRGQLRDAPEGWRKLGNQIAWDGEKLRLEKLSYETFRIQQELEAFSNPDDMPERWPVNVTYIDPLNQKEVRLHSFVEFDKEKSRIRTKQVVHTQEEMEKWKANPT